MTREEKKLALYCLYVSSDYHSDVCEECVKYPNCDHTGQDDVTETIIKALEQEPCDAVSREAVLALAKEECETAIIPYKRFIKGVNALPSLTPKQKTGKWIAEEDIIGLGGYYICSSCGNKALYSKGAMVWLNRPTRYCPYCGSKMVKQQESEDNVN